MFHLHFQSRKSDDAASWTLADLTSSTDAADGNVICHQTLDRDVGALCRGSVDRRAGQLVQVAGRLGCIVLEQRRATRADTGRPPEPVSAELS